MSVEIDGVNKIIKTDTISEATSANNLTLDVAGDIILDAGGSDISLKGNGAEYGKFNLTGNSLNIHSSISDGDILFKGSDGGSAITALTLDMSDSGMAHFNNYIKVSDRVVGSSNLVLTSTDANEKIHLDASGFMKFETDGGERMRIDSSGNVGIGTSSIDVSTQSGGNNYRVLQIENAEGGQINLDHNDAGTGSTLGQINFQRAGEVLAEIEGVTDGATDNGKINFRTQPDGGALAVRWTIDHNGILFPGATSQGIALGVTAATSSNILDDYEEGTFTYTISGSNSGNLVLRSGYARGEYVKIGNQVMIHLRYETTSDNSIDGNLQWSLPFTMANSNASDAGNAVSPGYIRDNSLGTNYRTGVYLVGQSEAYAQLLFSREGAATSTVELANDGNTDGVMEGVISIFYRTT